MRIGTYNVLGLTGYPPQAARERLGEAAAKAQHFCGVFSGLDCEVLALQEGPPLDVMRAIADRLGAYLAAFPSPTAYPGYILSRHPVRESRVYAHPGPGGREGPFSRSAGSARLDLGAGRDLWVTTVHLHPSEAALRSREAELLGAHLSGLPVPTGPSVVLGDFNCPLGEPVHEMLAGRGFVNAMLRAGGGIAPTMDTAGVRPLAIDHIYASGSLAGALASARVVRASGFRADEPAPPGTWVHSDHLPVVADLAWP